MSENQWPQPELSLGAPYGSLDILARYKFWEVKNNSPAHQAWRAVSEQIINLIEDQFEALDAQEADLMAEMFMIAGEEAEPSPTVLFRSQSKVARQRAIKLVHERSLLASYPGVMMADCSRLPRPLVIEEVSGMPALLPGMYSSDALRHCGASVIISRGRAGPLSKATLGGILCIGGLFYGMTTAYACMEAPKRAVDSETESDFALYGRSELDVAPEEEYHVVGMTCKGELKFAIELKALSTSKPEQRESSSSQSHLIPFKTAINEDVSTNENPGKRISETSVVDMLDKGSPGGTSSSSSERTMDRSATIGDSNDGIPSRLGTVSTSAPERGLDWALVAVENSNLMLENISLNNRRFMVNSVYWRNQSLHTSAIYPRRLAREPANVEVLICTGNRDDPLEGRLSASPSFQRIPGKNIFQELWVVKCIGGTFCKLFKTPCSRFLYILTLVADGDGGAWVVGCESGDLYGAITSGYSGTDIAYVTPAVEIFEDIDTFFGQQVEFSKPEQWASKGKTTSNTVPLTIPRKAVQRKQGPLQWPPTRDEREESMVPQNTTLVETNVTETVPVQSIFKFDQRAQSLEPWVPEPIRKGSSSVSLNEVSPTTAPPWAPNTSRSSFSASSARSTPPPLAVLTSSQTSTASYSLQNPSRGSTYQNPPCTTLYIRNLPANPSEIALRTLFFPLPGYRGLRMKLREPECFVQFTDVISASNALHKMDNYRFQAEDTWGFRVGYARNVPRSGDTILTIEEEGCILPEVYVPPPVLQIEQMEQLDLEAEVPSPATSRKGRIARLLTPGMSASRRRSSVSSLSEESSRKGSVPSVATIEKEEKREEKRKKKEQKKKEREKERQVMSTTDHYVRWGP
ncbi:Cell wall integrity protein [Lachnellula subtilissima]|uniref:Cell wall integrity protein n=1 Tax=Lachnellula subtilissima TaxID=602034 RepID=A0A8H8RPE5_9HELO|nr:Cell wall integrity protein [Lachnellula subtilissima]